MLNRLVAFAVAIILGGCAASTTAPENGDNPAGPDLASPPPDLASSMTGGPDAGTGGHPDLGPTLKMPGDPCKMDAECTTGACKPFGLGGDKQCALQCTTQAECDKVFSGAFCEPTAAGQPSGFCTPNSAMHCSSCSLDGDCGLLSERCMQAPGDIAPACHIDCALSGDAACPSDYACTAVPDGTGMRKLCLPKSKICLDALGGYCDRVTLPQPCARTNMAGSCTGQRTCLPGKRYDRCNAIAPYYKKNCTDLDPAGCMLYFAQGAANDKNNCGQCGMKCGANQDCCAGNCKDLGTGQNCHACGDVCGAGQGCCSSACTALSTVQNCGACGNICPGLGFANNDVSCANPAAKLCGMTCRGENYDVNGNPGDGCERVHPTPPGHDLATALDVGGSDCYGSTGSFSKTLLSDKRVHMNPAVNNFNGAAGSAPDWFHTYNTGGTFCADSYDVTITTAGGGDTVCYKLSFWTDKTLTTTVINGHGTGHLSGGKGSFSDNSDIKFIVEKVCSVPPQEAITYTVSYKFGPF